MSITFSGGELINIAINIEKSGMAFYDTMSRSTENATARAAFKELTQMERNHIKIFQDIALPSENGKGAGTAGDEYEGYLQALVNSAVFTDELTTSELATRVSGDIEALELGIEAEKDSILFYYEMRDIVPPRTRDTIDRIIKEEKSHLRQLGEIKRKLAAGK
ncbi:MAG: ferritin family protein [Dehalococcoidales bacterium]|nr:ferritin family protein [Dehalococcoidales bacterium]